MSSHLHHHPPHYLHLQHSIIHPYKAIQPQHFSNQQQITYLHSRNLQFVHLFEAPVSLPPLQLSCRTFHCSHTSRITLQDLPLQPHLCTTTTEPRASTTQTQHLQSSTTQQQPTVQSSTEPLAASTNLAHFVFFSRGYSLFV